jgi:hypothetical protein
MQPSPVADSGPGVAYSGIRQPDEGMEHAANVYGGHAPA